MPSAPEDSSRATLAAIDAFYSAGGKDAVQQGDMSKVIDAFHAVVQSVLRGAPAADTQERGQRKLLSADQAASVLGIGASTVRSMMRSGRLKYVRIGKGRKIALSEIDRYIGENQEVGGA